MQSIMLATDGSPSAEGATREAIELARALDVPLTVASVAHVEAPTAGTYGYAYADVMFDLRNTQRAHVERVLAAVGAQAEAAGVAVEAVALEGRPGEQICKAARERNPRLVVVGAHGFGWMGRVLHGSVSEFVLHHAEAPVLVVAGDAPSPAALEGVETGAGT